MTDIHHQAASQRSTLYHHLAEMLTSPSKDLLQNCRSGEQDRAMVNLLHIFPYELSWQLDTCSHDDSVTTMASEYMRVFELPIQGQPCPLYGGLYGGNRHEVMEELLRYYRFYGLSIDKASTGDLPDSIPTLLEFLQFLTYKEADTGETSELLSIRLTQKDLLERHLTKWVPAIRSQMEQRNAPAFYMGTITLLNAFIFKELSNLTD